ncbi:TonB-dependent receptor [uncultured Sphingomonas sp.]|uniref:TonB-dependent receptor domain-containing protein n=1 Tax=uncultured Sphingomonas sp. TaxID=158754 RepID=UPI002597C5C2|nr:TonB-dependent receptor [uncultured Sphingomonas sp.]
MSFREGALGCASVLALVAFGCPTYAAAQDQSVPAKKAAPNGAPEAGCPLTAGGVVDPACETDGTGTATPDDVREKRRDEIIVTGTRIRLPNLESLQPTVTVGEQYLQDRGLTNVADALNELPAFRGSVTPNGAQGSFGQGVNFVNAYGLGSNRTLTLVNGRRFVTSNVTTLFNQGSAGTQVDLNTINTLLTERADFISIGGSPVYGSDAISGTVNIILRDRFNGFRVQGTSGVTERGDGFHYSGSMLAGHDYLDGRANITIAYQHDHQDGVLYNNRDFYRDNLGGATNPTSAQAAALGRAASGITSLNDGRVNTGFGYNNSPTDGFPGTIQIKNETIYYLTPGGLITAAAGNANAAFNYQFDRNGNLVPFNRGIIFPSIYASGGDGFKFADYSQITSQLDREIANVFAHFDVSDAFKLFFEGEYFNSRAHQLARQPTFNSNLFGGSSGQLTFTSTSPFLTQQAQAQLAALGVTRFQVSRASSDLADLTGRSTTNLGRAVLGARGDFQVGGRNFNYEVAGNYGRTVIDDVTQDVNAQRFINAVNVTTNAAGQIVCTTTPTVQAAPGGTPVADPACVPLNLLGFGLSSPAARAYVIAENTTKSILEQKVFTASVTGSPFDLFGNAAGFNVGYEHREEKGRFTPSAFQQQGLGRSVGIAPVSGKYTVNEVFGEAVLRVFSRDNNFIFDGLTFKASGRYVDNTVNGGFFSWSAGGEFNPIRDIQLRGNYTKSFRAPAITELFLPLSNSFSSVPDLCAPGNINAGAAPATRAKNCAAFLAAFPNATPLDATAATVPAQSGGNPTLQNEISSSFTYGVVIQPRFIPGLSITADYIDINITNPISNLTVATIASACFDNSNFNAADPANGNAFCSQIRRYAKGQGGASANGGDRGGQVVVDPANPGVKSGFVNGNRILFTGIQGTLDYTTRLEGIGIPGRFTVGSNALFVRRRLVDITGVAPVRTDGTFGDPKFSGQVNATYANDVWGTSTSVNVMGQQIATRNELSLDLREFNTIKAYATVNTSLFVNVQNKMRFTFSVTNLLDRVGQSYFGYYPTTLISDALGRRFTVGVRANF